MDIKQAFNLALKSLLGSKLRSFLTMLGIIIGVASVIVLVSIVQGVTNEVVDIFENMGTNLISVSIRGRGGNRTVDADQMQQLVDENPDVLGAMSPMITVSGITVKNGDTNLSSTSCTGVNEFYKDVRNSNVQSGRFLSYMDVETKQYNCVIGTYVANSLFPGEEPLNQTLKINGYTFKVIGVLEEKQNGTEGSSDDTILIPYTVAQKLARMFMVSSYNFSAAEKEMVDQAMEVIENFLLKIFSNANAYSVYNQAEMLDQVNEMTGMLTMVLVGVAGISLLVGGIGIMNIMLVSVTERTREIGIRKSLGAQPWDIMSQFVVEAMTTSAMGGILGILLGIAAAYATTFFDLNMAISPGAILLAFSVSVIIGVAFGYFPAKKAARMNPIEALRYD